MELRQELRLLSLLCFKVFSCSFNQQKKKGGKKEIYKSSPCSLDKANKGKHIAP